jgi:hypothetical protein
MQIADEQPISIDILDLTGKTVITNCSDKVYGQGIYDINIPFGQMSSGTYILRVSGATETAINKFVVVK